MYKSVLVLTDEAATTACLAILLRNIVFKTGSVALHYKYLCGRE